MPDHAQPYFIAAMGRDQYQDDPAIIQATVGHLVEAMGVLGDLVILIVPPGEGSETSRKIGLSLGAKDGLGDIFPGLPGGPPG